MIPKPDRQQSKQPRPTEQPKGRQQKRFRIQKVEERIAPKSPHKTGSSTDQAFNSVF